MTTRSAPGEPAVIKGKLLSDVTHILPRMILRHTTSVNAAPENGELLPRAGSLEVKALVVVVFVRVVVAADLLAVLVVVAGLVHGCVDLGGGVGL